MNNGTAALQHAQKRVAAAGGQHIGDVAMLLLRRTDHRAPIPPEYDPDAETVTGPSSEPLPASELPPESKPREA